jgi:hypothetical protein
VIFYRIETSENKISCKGYFEKEVSMSNQIEESSFVIQSEYNIGGHTTDRT